MGNRKFSGDLGFIILPDFKTARRARETAWKLKEELALDYNASVAPIILLHAPLANLPARTAKMMLNRLRGFLNSEFSLQSLAALGNKYVAWLAVNNDVLREMHRLCLPLVAHLDRETPCAARRERLTLSNEETRNAEKYGCPFVENDFRPLIRLGFRGAGISFDRPRRLPHQTAITRVHLAEINGYGRFRIVPGF